MKKVLLLPLFLLLAFGFYAFLNAPAATPAETEGLKWYTWEEAMEANKENPKKIFVDIYTDWCGWCKRMDKTTFQDEKVQAYLAEHFYPVKLDGEQREDIQFQGYTFSFKSEYGRRGAHELAVQLLNGRMSYPSFVYLNEKVEIITTSPGYKPAQDLMKELKFIGQEIYIEKDWEEYSQGK